jgi:hypothetical protein
MTSERVNLSLLDRIAIPIVIAAMAFAASLLAAAISNSGTAENQRNQIEEQKRKDDRDRRNDVYLGFMDAVAGYAVPFRANLECLRAGGQSCAEMLRAAQEPERQLRNAFNRVALYGSDRVYRAGLRLYQAMLHYGNAGLAPGMVVPAPDATAPSREVAVPPVQQLPTAVGSSDPAKLTSDYENAYNDLLRVMCEELSAVPRARC